MHTFPVEFTPDAIMLLDDLMEMRASDEKKVIGDAFKHYETVVDIAHTTKYEHSRFLYRAVQNKKEIDRFQPEIIFGKVIYQPMEDIEPVEGEEEAPQSRNIPLVFHKEMFFQLKRVTEITNAEDDYQVLSISLHLFHQLNAYVAIVRDEVEDPAVDFFLSLFKEDKMVKEYKLT